MCLKEDMKAGQTQTGAEATGGAASPTPATSPSSAVPNSPSGASNGKAIQPIAQTNDTPHKNGQTKASDEAASDAVMPPDVVPPPPPPPPSPPLLAVNGELVSALDSDSEDGISVTVRDSKDLSLRPSFVTAPNTPVEEIFRRAADTFHYDPHTFSLAYQSLSGEQVELLLRTSSGKTISDVGFRERNLLFLEHRTKAGKSSKMWKGKTGDVSGVEGCEGESTSSTSKARTTDEDDKKSEAAIAYVGLVNQAMTCYLNSLLQTLFMTPEFRNALYRWEYRGSSEQGIKNIPCQLQRLFLQLQTAKRSAVETTRLTRSFGWDSSEVWQQHDVQELYRVMFDALEQCFKHTDQKHFINDLYQGKMKDYVKCLKCGTESAREDSFLDIPLPIRPFGSTTAYKSVEEALQAFVTPELLTEGNQYECSRCASLTDAHKGLKFTRFPYLLTLHLKRFDFDYQTFHRIKLNDRVTFPNLLDLNSFIEEEKPAPSSEMTDKDKNVVEGNAEIAESNGKDIEHKEESPSPTQADVKNTTVTNGKPVETTEKKVKIKKCSTCSPEKCSCVKAEKTKKKIIKVKSTKTKSTKKSEIKKTVQISTDSSIEKETNGTLSNGCITDNKTSDNSSLPSDNASNTIDSKCLDGLESSVKSDIKSTLTDDKTNTAALSSNTKSNDTKSLPNDSKPDCKSVKSSSTTPDRNDDASTTDSGSAFDVDDRSSVSFVGSPLTHAPLTISDTQDEDEGIDMSLSFTDKKTPGPYTYELFSIMVHSGSASGGHYYAYIKDFKDDEWYCFNDQSVSRLTYDDIRKTYGGAPEGGYYSSSWNSSANAYMLMYRQADKERNCHTFSPEQFPEHIKSLATKMVTEDEVEREAREIERHMFRVKVFYQTPGSIEPPAIEKFKIHRDTTLSEATKNAHEVFNLQGVIPLDRCRLVKYEEINNIMECSFEGREDEPLCDLLGGMRSSFRYDLILEVRDENKAFQVYKPGAGISVPVFTVNLTTGEVEGPDVIVRASQADTVGELKALISDAFAWPQDAKDKMRIIQERTSINGVHQPLKNDQATLKDEGFYKSNKVYVEASGDEAKDFFVGSQLLYILDRFENTISIICHLPDRSSEALREMQIPPYCSNTIALEQENASVASPVADTSAEIGQASNVICETSSPSCPPSSPTPPAAAEGDEDSNSSSLVNSDQSASEDSSLASDSDRTLVGDPPDEEEVDANVTSPDGLPKSIAQLYEDFRDSSAFSWKNKADGCSEVHRYFKAKFTEPDVLELSVDKRITIGQLKSELQRYVGVSDEHFKLYKYYEKSSHEFEYSRNCETLTSYYDWTVIRVRLGRPLKPGEYKGKVFLLQLQKQCAHEPTKFLLDWVVSSGQTVGEAKAEIVSEAVSKGLLPETDLSQIRIRKKSWKNPQAVHLDSHILGEDIILYVNWEFYLQVLDDPECRTKDSDELSIFVKRFRPSEMTFDPILDVVVNNHTAEAISEKISALSGIPLERVRWAKGRDSFPCDMSRLDAETELDWSPKEGTVFNKPLYIHDDGAVIYYKDAGESLMTLSETERSLIAVSENARLNDYYYSALPFTAVPIEASPMPVTRTREKGLKIYFPQSSVNESTEDSENAT